MIETILPASVATAEVSADPPDARLHPEEERAVARAVEGRRREFATGRSCARAALERLGVAAVALPSGPRGEPLWPTDVVGSITHCRGYRAAAVARASEVIALGIDAEPNEPLRDGLLADIARPEERPALTTLQRSRPEIRWDRLLFSAKESVYKAWFPLTERWLGFEDAVIALDAADRTFSARVLVRGPAVEGREVTCFDGRWATTGDLLLTAIAIKRQAE
jgi:enterobactin synthetase component D / holo-[acyl-carrier protein] synthase